MNALEDRLRDAFRADADLVRPDSMPPAPPRPVRSAPARPWSRRSRMLIPLGAAAAVIAIVTGLSLATSLLSGGSPGPQPPGSVPTGLVVPTPSARPPARLGPVPPPVLAANASRGVPASAPGPGLPRFFVTVYVPPVGGVDYIVVRDTATGEVTGRINPPGGTVFAGLAATAGDRTFITTIDPDTGCRPVQLYQFRLNHSGMPGPLQPLHIAVPGGISQGEGDLAITPDGETIAYDMRGCTAAGQGEVGVISLATRQARAWAVPPGNPISSQIMDVSLSADGRLLGFATFSGTRVLATSAPPGSVFGRSRLVSATVIWAAIAPGGEALYGCSVSPFRSGQPIPAVGTLAYGRISLTGADHVIASWPDVTGPQCYASLDPAGNYLLVQFPVIAHGVDDWSRPAVLDLRTGRLTDINAPAFYGPFDIAW